VESDHRQSACVTQSPVRRFRLFSSQIRLDNEHNATSHRRTRGCRSRTNPPKHFVQGTSEKIYFHDFVRHQTFQLADLFPERGFA
jgi:hypothetical protein